VTGAIGDANEEGIISQEVYLFAVQNAVVVDSDLERLTYRNPPTMLGNPFGDEELEPTTQWPLPEKLLWGLPRY
jgi:hypothetical protein